MRIALGLIASLIVGTLIFTPTELAYGIYNCPPSNCLYLPLVGNPPTPPVNVYEINQSRSISGYLRFTGDIIVYRPVYEVIVEVRFFDEYGNLLKFSKPVMLKASLPGQLNPFDIVTNVTTVGVEPGIIPVEASAIDWNEESEKLIRNVTVVSVAYEDYYQGTLVTAEVRNDEASPLVHVNGVIWSIQQTTQIIPVDVTDSLDPGESATFFHFVRGANEIPKIHVSAQGVLQP